VMGDAGGSVADDRVDGRVAGEGSLGWRRGLTCFQNSGQPQTPSWALLWGQVRLVMLVSGLKGCCVIVGRETRNSESFATPLMLKVT
jgi:hypothetical protein